MSSAAAAAAAAVRRATAKLQSECSMRSFRRFSLQTVPLSAVRSLSPSTRLLHYGTQIRAAQLAQPSLPSLRSMSSEAVSGEDLLSGFDLSAPACNVPPHIAACVGKNLHMRPDHPLCVIKRRIQRHLGDDEFLHLDDLSPVVSTVDNFDLLCIPKDHVSRSRSDTYHLDDDTVLRTHTSAHQVDVLQRGSSAFTVAGDVYRRDQIDSSHYPVFHQMEGVKVMEHLSDLPEDEAREAVLKDLKETLSGLARALFGTEIEVRWIDAYFPFTEPSLELEIWYGGEWLEVLGCGVVQPSILEAAGTPHRHAWAFGLGLERLAMVLHDVPDIRLFWSTDPRFSDQFANLGDDLDAPPVQFQPYSKYPPCYKDVSFWLPEGEEIQIFEEESDGEPVPSTTTFHANDLNEIVRQVAGDLVEQVILVDAFKHPKTNKISHCYRISYRSMDRNLTNAEIDELQWKVRDLCVDKLGVELR